MIGLLLAALLLPPVPAARVAARITDTPEAELVAIVRRESRGERVGIHERDAWTSSAACRKAVRTGWLDDGVRCGAGWGTRGSFGLLAAYNLRYIWLDCAPWVLDVPIVSAIAAARRFDALCPGDAWCPRGEA